MRLESKSYVHGTSCILRENTLHNQSGKVLLAGTGLNPLDNNVGANDVLERFELVVIEQSAVGDHAVEQQDGNQSVSEEVVSNPQRRWVEIADMRSIQEPLEELANECFVGLRMLNTAATAQGMIVTTIVALYIH